MINNINNFFVSHNKANKAKNEAHLSVFYMNDMHGDINRASKMKTARDYFEKQNQAEAKMALGAGDLLYGKDEKRLNAITKILNAFKLDATCFGNHEFHSGSEKLADNIKDIDTTFVCANVEIPKGNKLQERIGEKKLVKSATFMKGGHKFAVIGASPFDTDITTKEKQDGTGIKQMSVEQTIKAINEETKKLEAQGVNKIILCSHTGYGEHADLKIARETEGIDVIIGGHSHTVVEGANTTDKGGDNKLNVVKSKRGETVVITQAGKNNTKAGFLDLVFDKNGVIKEESIVNKLANVEDFKADDKLQTEISGILGENKILSTPKHSYMPINEFQDRYMENPVANAVADSVLYGARKLDKSVLGSLVPTNTLKKGVEGQVSTYDIKYDMLPYNGDHYIVDIKEKDLVKLLETTSGTLFKNFDPQLLRCSGIKYTVDENADKGINGHIKSLEFVNDKNEVVKSIDVKNPSETDTVRVTLYDFLFQNGDTKELLAPYKESAKLVGTEQDLFAQYLEENKNVDFDKKSDKRINIKYENLNRYCYQYDMADKKAALKQA